MNAYIIIFKPDPSRLPDSHYYQPLHDAIQFYNPLMLPDLIYLIRTAESLDQVWNRISLNNAVQFTAKDCLYLIPLSEPPRGYGPQRFRHQLEDFLSEE